MRAVLEHHHPCARDSALKVRNGFRDRLVMAAREKQHRQFQFRQAIASVVVAQQSGRGEFTGAHMWRYTWSPLVTPSHSGTAGSASAPRTKCSSKTSLAATHDGS